jgi:hypothetical protein
MEAVMHEIHPNLFVGPQSDYEQLVAGQPGWSIVHAAKEPFHREAVGYTGANPEKAALEYFVARRGNRLMLNLIDAPIDVDIPETIFQAALAFIHERLAAGDRVMIHCEQGVSRSATLGLLYLLRHTTALANTACRDGLRRYHEIYPPFSPGRAMRYSLTRQWAAYGGLPE